MKKRLVSAIMLAAVLGLAACAESDGNRTNEKKLSKKYADLDNRSFKYDGHLYTLGVSKLQDFLDNGVVFNEEDDYDKVFQRKLTGDLSFDRFYYTVNEGDDGFFFVNPVDSNVPKRDCILAIVECNSFDDVRKGKDNKFSFAFPLTLTKDMLFKNSGEPTGRLPEFDGNQIYSYLYNVASENFPEHESGYNFLFYDDVTLGGVSISWLP